MAEIAAATIEVAPNNDQNQNSGNQNVDYAKLPDDHPLVKTLAKLREEMAGLKAKADESAKKIVEADQASTLDGQLTAAQSELAKAKLAIKYGLSETDAAMLPDGDQAEAIAKRFAEGNTKNGGLPVIEGLGNLTNQRAPKTEDEAAKFLETLFKP